jgi:thermostable 8-oxoguanine DNA glycosylase
VKKDLVSSFFMVLEPSKFCLLQTEENMRVQYDKKWEELKVLYERGAEAQKLEAIGICIRNLSTKISVGIQAVNAISRKINKLRDEELLLQTCELIQGYAMCISFLKQH